MDFLSNDYFMRIAVTSMVQITNTTEFQKKRMFTCKLTTDEDKMLEPSRFGIPSSCRMHFYQPCPTKLIVMCLSTLCLYF